MRPHLSGLGFDWYTWINTKKIPWMSWFMICVYWKYYKHHMVLSHLHHCRHIGRAGFWGTRHWGPRHINISQQYFWGWEKHQRGETVNLREPWKILVLYKFLLMCTFLSTMQNDFCLFHAVWGMLRSENELIDQLVVKSKKYMSHIWNPYSILHLYS